MSKPILRRTEANFSENRDRSSTVDLSLFSTCCKFALLERFDLAPFCLQNILTSENFRKDDDYLHLNS